MLVTMVMGDAYMFYLRVFLATSARVTRPSFATNNQVAHQQKSQPTSVSDNQLTEDTSKKSAISNSGRSANIPIIHTLTIFIVVVVSLLDIRKLPYMTYQKVIQLHVYDAMAV